MSFRLTWAALPMSSLVEDNAEVIAKRRMPLQVGRKHLLFLPAIGSNGQAIAGQGYATVGRGERADAVAREVGIGRRLMIATHAGELG